MKRWLALLFLIVLVVGTLKAQGDIDEQDQLFYQDERTWAGHIRTNGVGVNYRYAKRIDGYRKTLYLVQFDHIKDVKEKKTTNTYTSSYRTYVYGKLNYFYSLKAGMGFQKEMFRKQDIGSVSIRYFYTLGPSLGILKPIYYDMLDYAEAGPVTRKFEGEAHVALYQIYGKAPYTKGLNETTVVPGLFIKAGLSFEYSKISSRYHALEAGIMFDVYAKHIPILYSDNPKNQHFLFPTLYLSYRFGKIIDSQFKNNINKLDRILSE